MQKKKTTTTKIHLAYHLRKKNLSTLCNINLLHRQKNKSSRVTITLRLPNPDLIIFFAFELKKKTKENKNDTSGVYHLRQKSTC